MLMVTVDGHGSGYREISVTADDIFFFFSNALVTWHDRFLRTGDVYAPSSLPSMYPGCNGAGG